MSVSFHPLSCRDSNLYTSFSWYLVLWLYLFLIQLVLFIYFFHFPFSLSHRQSVALCTSRDAHLAKCISFFFPNGFSEVPAVEWSVLRADILFYFFLSWHFICWESHGNLTRRTSSWRIAQDPGSNLWRVDLTLHKGGNPHRLTPQIS